MRPPVAPYLTVSPAMAAIAFYTAVFGARQKAIMPALDGMRIMHCELEINGGSVMLADAFPEFGQTRMPLPGELATASVSLEYAEAKTVDEIFAKATGLGAKAETSPTNSFWGTRVATFRDPFGHRWILNAPLA
jgi:uncharacterized glyoxalase superfamily protein PhnB